MVNIVIDTEKKIGLVLLLILGISILVCPVAAASAISTIQRGNTVFIGEQGLDITAAMDGDSILGWWASGSTSTNPDYTIPLSNPGSFTISSSDFASRTGNWYHLSSLDKANGTAFLVVDPTLGLRVWDTTVNVDVTDKWVSTDDDIQFQIDTNLVQMTQRGVTVPVAIKVRSPNGAIFTSLTDKNGVSTSIDPYQISSTPQYTGSIWSTKNRDTYPPGTYSIWVECNVNSMKDNYGQTGKTISRTVSLLNQDRNPLIGNPSYVTNPTTSVTTVTTRIPTTIITKTTTPVQTTTLPTTIPVTETPAPVETLPPSPAIIESTTVPTTHTPGFGTGLAIAAAIFGLVLFLRKE